MIYLCESLKIISNCIVETLRKIVKALWLIVAGLFALMLLIALIGTPISMYFEGK